MVDNVNPTSQFHPYQPQDATPNADKSSSALSSVLGRFGIDQSKIDSITDKVSNMDVSGTLSKARGAARNNSGLVLGSLAAIAIGAGLMRKRSMRTV